MNRKERKRLGQQTVAILEQGHYEIDGRRVDLEPSLACAVERTVEYTKDDGAPGFEGTDYDTRIEVENEGSLTAASRLAHAGQRVAVLNFASAKNPGGGFLNGSLAQEESLAMSSGLYSCLVGREMYDYHRPTRGGMYTNWVIYSPEVPVFRGEDGTLLETPYEVAFLTSPAPNAGAVRKHAPERLRDVRREMQTRIDKVLAVAAHYGHDALVLGAWGCGVFGNDPAEVAALFADALTGRFARTFERVVFAVLDGTPERRFVGPFEQRLGQAVG